MKVLFLIAIIFLLIAAVIKAFKDLKGGADGTFGGVAYGDAGHAGSHGACEAGVADGGGCSDGGGGDGGGGGD